MKKRNLSTIILAVFMLSGCGPSRINESFLCGVLHDYHFSTIKSSDSICVARKIFGKSISYSYTKGTDTLSLSFTKPIESDSLIIYIDTECPLIASKTFNIKDQDFEVLKYYFDVEEMYDEETSFFFHSDYGILVIYNNGWSSLISSLEFDNMSRVIVDSILNDRSGFYLRNIPPPLPADSFSTIIHEL